MGHSFRDLIVWRKAKILATEVYQVSGQFPKQETHGLTSQIRRAAVSVASNIAEGQGRMTAGEFLQFLGHARGSLYEVETQLEIAHELGYVNDGQFHGAVNHIAEVRRMLHGLCDSLKK